MWRTDPVDVAITGLTFAVVFLAVWAGRAVAGPLVAALAAVCFVLQRSYRTTKVHTPGPGHEHPGAAGALAGSLLNQGTAQGLEASLPRTYRWPA
jgi:hypothetical protein